MAHLFSQRFTRAETQRLEESPKTWPRSNQVQILAAASLRQGRQRLHATRQSSEAAQMDTPTVIANSPGVHICCNVHTGMELRVRARLGPSLVRVRDAEAKQPGSAKRDMNVEHFFSNTLDALVHVLVCSLSSLVAQFTHTCTTTTLVIKQKYCWSFWCSLLGCVTHA